MIRLGWRKRAVQHISRFGLRRSRFQPRRSRFWLRRSRSGDGKPRERLLFHDTVDALGIDGEAPLAESRRETGPPVGAVAFGMEGAQVNAQRGVRIVKLPRFFEELVGIPDVPGATGDLENPTEDLDGIVGFLCANEPVAMDYRDSFAKKAAAFFKMSRSI